MSFPTVIFGPEGEQFNIYTAPTRFAERRRQLGTQMILPDGRKFRFCRMGGTLGVVANLFQAPIPIANHLTVTVQAAAAVDATSIAVTLGATASSVDEYADGYFVVEDDAGEGYVYKIDRAHDAVASAGVFTIPLAPGSTVQVAMTTSTTGSLIRNQYADAIIHPSPPTAQVVGFPASAITANNYGWLQTAGVGAALADGTLIIYNTVVPSDGVDGAVEDGAAAITDGTPPTGHGQIQPIGVVIDIGATTEECTLRLNMD